MRQKQAMCQETVKDQETYSTSAELLQGVAFAIKGELIHHFFPHPILTHYQTLCSSLINSRSEYQ